MSSTPVLGWLAAGLRLLSYATYLLYRRIVRFRAPRWLRVPGRAAAADTVVPAATAGTWPNRGDNR